MKIDSVKGFNDFIDEEALKRAKIKNILVSVFEKYGFQPAETPIIEYEDFVKSKNQEDEAISDIFKLKDKGKRNLALRYEFTFQLKRIAKNKKLPYKRYQIGEVFRDEPSSSNRFRQFTQCDVDIVGVKEMTADAEIIALTARAFKKLGFDIVMKVNNRKLLNELLLNVGIKKDKLETVLLTIDKLEKFGLETVKKELKQKKINNTIIKKILEVIDIKGTNKDKINKIKKIINESEGLDEIRELFSLLNILNVDAEFDPSLARGLSYYTGTVIEVLLKDRSVKTSVCAGGRYDKMIGAFLGKGDYPAVGISFGVDRIYDAYVEKNKMGQKTVTKVYIIPIGTFNDSFKIAEELRNENVEVDIDLTGKGQSKNLKYANALGIPYVLFIGEEELKQGKVKLKDMNSGKEQLMNAEELVVFLNKDQN